MGFLSRKKKKDVEVTQQGSNEKDTPKDYWLCPKCESQNSLASRSCKDCGYYR